MPAVGHDEVLVEEKENSTDQGGVLHQAGKWYTGGRRFSLPVADQKVLIEEKIRSTEQKEVAHWKEVRLNITEQYTEGPGFSLQTTDLKRAFDKTENQEKALDQRQHKSLSADHRSENQPTKDDQKSFEKSPNKTFEGRELKSNSKDRTDYELGIAIKRDPDQEYVSPERKRPKIEMKKESFVLSQTTKALSCNWCHLTLSSNHELKRHLLTHGEYERNFLCESCDQTFSKVQQLQQHRQIHASTKPFSCVTCGKDLKNEKALDIHKLMKHTESEKIQCRKCPGRVFKNEATLKVHLAGHKGFKKGAA